MMIDMGYVSDVRRLNVAITRAWSKLIRMGVGA
ncbi:AAA domain-containing protein [Nitratifractor sp.]